MVKNLICSAALRFGAAIAIPLSVVGCGIVAAAVPVIAQIVSVIADANAVLDTIDVVAQDVFRRTNASEEVRAKYQDVLLKAYTALNAAAKAVSGANELTQEEYDAAFAQFKLAYAELKSLIQSFGIVTPDGLLASSPSAVVLQDPLALTYKVE